jgi:hypothetical protein
MSDEQREGKVMSAENQAHLVAAHKHLAAIADAADTDLEGDDTSDDDTASEDQDATENGPDPSPASAQDGTGSRAAFVAAFPARTAPAVASMVHRGGAPSGMERR